MNIDFMSLIIGLLIGLLMTCTIVVLAAWCDHVSVKSALKEMDRLKDEREASK